MKRFSIILGVFVVALIGLLAGGYIFLSFKSIDPPPEWLDIQIGDSRQEVLRAHPDLQTGNYMMKRMDMGYSRRPDPLYGIIGQWMNIMYNDSEQVEQIHIYTHTRRFGPTRRNQFITAAEQGAAANP